MKKLLLGALAVLAVMFAATAAAAPPAGMYTPFGGATVSGNTVTLKSNATTPYSGIDLGFPAGATLNNGLNALDITFSGDCGGGSPRFELNFGTASNLFIYLGDAPNFTCTNGTYTYNDLLDPSSGARFDLSQFGGPFYGTYQDALNMVGNMTIQSIDVVADSGWFFPNGQTVVITRVSVNGQALTAAVGPPTSKDACKNGGWKTYNNPAFKNQGDCVSYVATGGRNPANG
jgi:hypothetical protein